MRCFEAERRADERFPTSQQPTLRAVELPNLGVSSTASEPIVCSLQNVSNAGMCIRTSIMLGDSRILRCQIPIEKTPVAIPTLAQVCWSLPDENLIGYLTGLRFIF